MEETILKRKLFKLALVAATAAFLLGLPACSDDDDGKNGGEGDTSQAFTGKIYIVGDSTVCSFDDNYYLPRYGYGTQISKYINVADENVENLALSGRSSKSFLTEENYTKLKNSIASGDYLIIGFGHNDEKSDEAERYTDPNGTYTQATTANGDSFAYVLYEKYIKVAAEKSATAILCTPIVRYDANGNYTGAKIHDTTSSDSSGKGGDYAKAIKDLGAAVGVTVIDLTSLTKAVYAENNDEAKYFHAHTTYEGTKPNETPAGRDDTHINKYGAKMVAYQFAQALLGTDCPLKGSVKTDVVAPTKAVDYTDAINAEYTKPDYTSFDPEANTENALGDGWYKTAMGDIGGDSKVSAFTIDKNAGKFMVGCGTNNGKIAGSSDGFAAAFMQIDVSRNFTATATVTIVKKESVVSSQSGFGMMLRDDIYINTSATNIASNYVAAGILETKATIFSRENGALKNGDEATTTAVDNTFALEINRVGQTVICKVAGSEKTFTDFDFVAVDNDYMYLCLFANRGFVVEFTNVNFEYTGESQGA